MVLGGRTVSWYQRVLHPLIVWFDGTVDGVSRIAICEAGGEISIILDNHRVVTIDGESFKVLYCEGGLVRFSGFIADRVMSICYELNTFKYRVRQIVIYNSGKDWFSDSIESGEFVKSKEKPGEGVVILKY